MLVRRANVVLIFARTRREAKFSLLNWSRDLREILERAFAKEPTLSIIDGCDLRLSEARVENESEKEERSKRSSRRERSVNSLRAASGSVEGTCGSTYEVRGSERSVWLLTGTRNRGKQWKTETYERAPPSSLMFDSIPLLSPQLTVESLQQSRMRQRSRRMRLDENRREKNEGELSESSSALEVFLRQSCCLLSTCFESSEV